MSHFTTPLDTRLLRGQFKQGRQLYLLLAPLGYYSDKLQTEIVVPKDYVTDLASVPKLPLTWLLAGGTANEAAVVHDWLYTVHSVNGRPITRAQADSVFLEAIPASKDPNAPAPLMWLAVRLGGWGAWNSAGPTQTPELQALIDFAHPDGP